MFKAKTTIQSIQKQEEEEEKVTKDVRPEQMFNLWEN